MVTIRSSSYLYCFVYRCFHVCVSAAVPDKRSWLLVRSGCCHRCGRGRGWSRTGPFSKLWKGNPIWSEQAWLSCISATCCSNKPWHVHSRLRLPLLYWLRSRDVIPKTALHGFFKIDFLKDFSLLNVHPSAVNCCYASLVDVNLSVLPVPAQPLHTSHAVQR